jgi:putative acetyltransferase
MVTLKRTDARHKDFIALVWMLDADLARRDGAEHSFYAAYNTIDTIRHVVLAYQDDAPVGCGAIKKYAAGIMEVKRMYVPPQGRRKGVASSVLAELERWAEELGCSKCILETGKKQPEAIALYTKRGYTPIPNYGHYAGVDNSVCFEKVILPNEPGTSLPRRSGV